MILKTGAMMEKMQLKGIHYILLFIKWKAVILNCNKMSKYYCFYYIFD